MRDRQFNAIGCAFLLLIIVFLAAVCFLCLYMERRITALELSQKRTQAGKPVYYPVSVVIEGEQWQRVYKGLPGMVGQAKSLRSVGDLREARR